MISRTDTSDLKEVELVDVATDLQKQRRTNLLLMLGLLVAIIVIAAMAFVTSENRMADLEQRDLIAFQGLGEEVRKTLVEGFRDGNGDLLADPPTELSQLLDPKSIVLAHYPGDDEGRLRVDWDGLQLHLRKEMGKSVHLQAYLHTSEEIEMITQGEIHLVAAHSAEVPLLVNNAGFVPVAELGTPNGPDGNKLLIAVAPESDINKLEDLRGETLVCTEPDSITGYRAAIVAIAEQTGMRPGIDYDIYYSHKQERSIRGLAIGKFKFVALSYDVLQRMLEESRVKEADYRVIYESQVIPRLTIGYIHNLIPELCEKAKAAILSFENQGGGDKSLEVASGFFPIDYQRDYLFLRRLDDAFEPRFSEIFEGGGK